MVLTFGLVSILNCLFPMNWNPVIGGFFLVVEFHYGIGILFGIALNTRGPVQCKSVSRCYYEKREEEADERKVNCQPGSLCQLEATGGGVQPATVPVTVESSLQQILLWSSPACNSYRDVVRTLLQQQAHTHPVLRQLEEQFRIIYNKNCNSLPQ